MVLQAWIVNNAGFSWELSWADSLISNFLLAIVCFAMSHTLRYYRPEKANSLYLVPWALVLAGIWLWTVSSLLSIFYPESTSYLLFLKQSLAVRYCLGFLVIGWFVLLNWIWYYLKTRQEDEHRQQLMKNLAREAELSDLRRQLQPHFLFNSLNSISALTVSQPDEARLMIQKLSDFLRGTLKKDERQMPSLEEELQHLKLYLEIEKLRFGHRLKTLIESEEESRKLTLPSLLLQPIVENAIKFGLYDTIGDVTIRITAKIEANNLIVRVENPFDPATIEMREGTGFGLSSVQRRLYLLFARNDLLQTQGLENQFITTVKIPQKI
jgi:two-component system, LytTR family, sensor kinase